MNCSPRKSPWSLAFVGLLATVALALLVPQAVLTGVAGANSIPGTPQACGTLTNGFGYDLGGADGGVYTFDSPFYGSFVNRLSAPAVAFAKTSVRHTTHGGPYYEVTGQGHVYPSNGATF